MEVLLYRNRSETLYSEKRLDMFFKRIRKGHVHRQQFLCGIPAEDYIFQKDAYEDQIKKSAELIKNADAILPVSMLSGFFLKYERYSVHVVLKASPTFFPFAIARFRSRSFKSLSSSFSFAVFNIWKEWQLILHMIQL